MTPASFDVIVLGLGAMGSAAAAALARRGVSCLGLDAFHPPHDRGSSHGETRVIREAYFEHPLYVPLVRRARELWRQLEERRRRRLMETTGALLIGSPRSELIAGAGKSAREHYLDCEELTAEEIHHRFPQLHPPPEAVGLFEPRAGVLFPEECIRALLEEAAEGGAELHHREPAAGWTAAQGEVEVRTPSGRYRGGRLLVAAGAWIPELLPQLPLQVERQVMHLFRPGSGSSDLAPGCLPIFLCAEDDGALWYGLPDFGHGVKVALHHGGATVKASSMEGRVERDDVEAVRRRLRERLPTVDCSPARSAVCMYTNTPDGHFLVDRLPPHSEVLVASACSGHGFKFASVLGEILAALLTGEPHDYDIAPFGLDRAALRAGREPSPPGRARNGTD